MGMIPLSEELQRLVEREVAAGRAATPAAFVEEAVLRLIEDAHALDDEIARVAAEGIADIEAGRYVAITTEDEHRALAEDFKARLRARLAGSV
jgi:hypothetical protein